MSSLTTIERRLSTGQSVTILPRQLDRLLQDLVGQVSENLEQVTVTGVPHAFSDHATLIPRTAMPQLPETSAELSAMVAALATTDITCLWEQADPRTLRATQDELDSVKVAQLYEEIITGGWHKDSVIIISIEGDVVDGHHRWAAALAACITHGPFPINTLRIDLPLPYLLEKVAKFSGDHKALGQALDSAQEFAADNNLA